MTILLNPIFFSYLFLGYGNETADFQHCSKVQRSTRCKEPYHFRIPFSSFIKEENQGSGILSTCIKISAGS